MRGLNGVLFSSYIHVCIYILNLKVKRYAIYIESLLARVEETGSDRSWISHLPTHSVRIPRATGYS